MYPISSLSGSSPDFIFARSSSEIPFSILATSISEPIRIKTYSFSSGNLSFTLIHWLIRLYLQFNLFAALFAPHIYFTICVAFGKEFTAGTMNFFFHYLTFPFILRVRSSRTVSPACSLNRLYSAVNAADFFRACAAPSLSPAATQASRSSLA